MYEEKHTKKIKSAKENQRFVAFGKGVNKYAAVAVISVVAVIAMLILVVVIAAILQTN